MSVVVIYVGVPAFDDDACYRAMDFLHETTDELEKQVFDEVANLLNLEVDCCSSTPPAPTSNWGVGVQVNVALARFS